MPRLIAIARRAPLLTLGLLLLLVKCVQFAIDSQALFYYYDSGSFILNAMGVSFIPERSYVYGALIRAFAVPFHSLRAIVAMQMAMGALTAWLLACALLRFLQVRPWIAILVAVAFTFDPVQVIHEHMVMAETAALLATALFLLVALQYLADVRPAWLILLSFCGVVLVSLRIVYLPVVMSAALLLPMAAHFPLSRKRLRLLALALAVSCGSTWLFQQGYRHLTGLIAGREPAYHYTTGYFLVAAVAPLLEPTDTADARIAQAITAQNQSSLPLANPDLRSRQLWNPEGLVARIKAVFGGDDQQANQAAQRLARAAIQRNPLGFLGLGLHNYVAHWTGIPSLRETLPEEDGTQAPSMPSQRIARVVWSVFGADVSKLPGLDTPSRRYHLFGRYWCLFLLASPFLALLACRLSPANPKGVAVLCVWSGLLLIATCLGAVQPAYRFLHPFSFTGLAAVAVLFERLARTHAGGARQELKEALVRN